jgi:hypothetical protein
LRSFESIKKLIKEEKMTVTMKTKLHAKKDHRSIIHRYINFADQGNVYIVVNWKNSGAPHYSKVSITKKEAHRNIDLMFLEREFISYFLPKENERNCNEIWIIPYPTEKLIKHIEITGALP